MEPVEIVILPAGKSLDVCAALREAEKVRKMDTSHKRARRRRKKANGRPGGEVKEGAGMDMFDFLNTKILNKGVSWCDNLIPCLLASETLSSLKIMEIEDVCTGVTGTPWSQIAQISEVYTMLFGEQVRHNQGLQI